MTSTAPTSAVLRLSVTDRCNLRCRYCVPVHGVPLPRRAGVLPLDGLAEQVRWLVARTQIGRVKLTGGEPLVRRDLDRLVGHLVALPGIEEVSATSNGTLLPRLAPRLAAAGLARVNISLDTLDPVRFAALTRGGRLADTLEGIDAALAAGLRPVKLNSVLLADSWRDDVPLLLDLAASRGLELRFIELMHTGTAARWAAEQLVEVNEVRRWLGLASPIAPSGGASGPARLEDIRWSATSVRVGWITPQSHPFCGECRRLRLDSFGDLRRCLMDSTRLSLTEVRHRHGDELATAELTAYLAAKEPPVSMASELPMAAVGG